MTVPLYYYAILALSWITLAILCVLLHENNRIPKEHRAPFYATYALIFLASCAELAGLVISTRGTAPALVLRVVKAADYILTPLSGFALALQVRKKNVVQIIMGVLVGANTVFQIVSIGSGWMVTMTAEGGYEHGPLYAAYTVVYAVMLVLVVVQLSLYSRGFKNRNKVSLYAIILLLAFGILLQELSGGDARVAYLTMTLSAGLLFIHVSEFSLMTLDDTIEQQQTLITLDPLTGLQNRYAYSEALKSYRNGTPSECVIFLCDVNGLKRVNDSLGHEAGDMMIKGAAECIDGTIGVFGQAYRIGGDEFVVLAKIDREHAERLIKDLEKATKVWTNTHEFGEGHKINLTISAGFAVASEYDFLTGEQLARKADENMYVAKTAYYAAAEAQEGANV